MKQPIEGTPASKVGLKVEDKIVRIEETSTINMDIQEAVSLLRGRVGTLLQSWLCERAGLRQNLLQSFEGALKLIL